MLKSEETNHNDVNILVVGKYQGQDKRRFLIQFDDKPTGCNRVASAKLYIKYYESHLPSGVTGTNIKRTFQVHQVSVW